VRAHPDTFNPIWTLARARAEEQKWHAALGTDTRIACAGGVALDTVIDYLPLPIRWEHNGFSFVALQSGKALHSEGAAMNHCARTYWGHVISGQSRIYSIVEAGSRVATLELACQPAHYKRRSTNTSTAKKSGRYRVRQLVGHGNATATPKVAKVVRTFVKEINNA